MTPEQIQQFNMLQDVITEFSENPFEKRSISYTGGCFYNPRIDKPLSKGCAIGMYLTTSVAKKLDKFGDTSIQNIMVNYSNLLPKWLTNINVSFLSQLQGLHDGNSYWGDKSLTNYGIETVKQICIIYNLPFKDLKIKKIKHHETRRKNI